jgi:hypothetical protein
MSALDCMRITGALAPCRWPMIPVGCALANGADRNPQRSSRPAPAPAFCAATKTVSLHLGGRSHHDFSASAGCGRTDGRTGGRGTAGAVATQMGSDQWKETAEARRMQAPWTPPGRSARRWGGRGRWGRSFSPNGCGVPLRADRAAVSPSTVGLFSVARSLRDLNPEYFRKLTCS